MVRPVPLQIPGLDNVTAVAGGYGTGFALRSDGTVWSLGDGSFGALGDGDDERYSTVPVQVSGLTDITAIAAGSQTGYALGENGSVWAWGDGSWGQLGNGEGGPSARNLVPVQVPGLTGVIAIGGGTFTGYALRGDGTVAAWGEGHYGELGDGTTTTSSAGPVQVLVPTGITAIAAGGFNGYAVRDDSTALAWGQGYFGQLGNGTTADGLQPAAVLGVDGVTAIAGGGYSEYAITR